jgi:hypothetical protein
MILSLYSIDNAFSFFTCLPLLIHSERTKALLPTPQSADDPLLAAVNLLEANWISVQDVFELVSRVLSRMFVGLWPKKKSEAPVSDLG